MIDIRVKNYLAKIAKALNSPFRAWVEKSLAEQAAADDLRIVIQINEMDWSEAVEYYNSSAWSIDQLSEYVAWTGELPPDGAKWHPDATLRVLDYTKGCVFEWGMTCFTYPDTHNHHIR